MSSKFPLNVIQQFYLKYIHSGILIPLCLSNTSITQSKQHNTISSYSLYLLHHVSAVFYSSHRVFITYSQKGKYFKQKPPLCRHWVWYFDHLVIIPNSVIIITIIIIINKRGSKLNKNCNLPQKSFALLSRCCVLFEASCCTTTRWMQY
jgi:hypothetical protein